MEILIMGILAGFNLLIILKKFVDAEYLNAVTDLLLLTVLNITFGGSLGGMMVSTVASFMISLYLFINPPKITFLMKRKQTGGKLIL